MTELNSDLGGCSFEQENGNFYVVGADAVRKKLCSNGIAYLGEMPYTCAKDYGECTFSTPAMAPILLKIFRMPALVRR